VEVPKTMVSTSLKVPIHLPHPNPPPPWAPWPPMVIFTIVRGELPTAHAWWNQHLDWVPPIPRKL
jgi:hypothetical protein